MDTLKIEVIPEAWKRVDKVTPGNTLVRDLSDMDLAWLRVNYRTLLRPTKILHYVRGEIGLRMERQGITVSWDTHIRRLRKQGVRSQYEAKRSR